MPVPLGAPAFANRGPQRAGIWRVGVGIGVPGEPDFGSLG
jgi:hypothetical protein